MLCNYLKETLGWTQKCWDFGLCDPDSEDKDWDELTPDERGAGMYSFVHVVFDLHGSSFVLTC